MADTDTDIQTYDVSESAIPWVDPDAKVLSQVQEEFVKPHIDWCPVQIKLESVVTTITEHTCCWQTGDDHKIILGGEGCLTVLRDNGVEKTYKLWNIDLRVVSGLAVTSEKQLICVEDLYSNAKEVHTVNIPHGLSHETELHYINTLDIMDPVCLFVFDKLHYGVLCDNSSIECYTLKNILLDREPAASDVIKLDIDISGMDTACATPDGNMIVTSYDNRSIYVFNVNGDLLNTFCPSNTRNLDGDWHQIFWDGQQHRLFVQCYTHGVIMTSDNGVICTLTKENCVRENAGDAFKSLTNISSSVSSEGRIWLINGDKRNEVHIYICDKASKPQTDTERQVQCRPIVILEPHVGVCPKDVKYCNTITTKNNHNVCWGGNGDNNIYLGGRNTITLLRGEETETCFNLWDHSLNVISGLAVTSEKMLICVKDSKWNTTAHVIDLPRDLKDGTQLNSVRKLIVSNPVFIFSINKFCYGFLCRPWQIKCFFLRDILFDHGAMGSREITLDLGISEQDTACSTPDENYCVTSWLEPAISVYNPYGDLLFRFSLNSKMGVSNIDDWLSLFLDGPIHRLFVYSCKDGIVLTSDRGTVCSLKETSCNDMYITHIGKLQHNAPIGHCGVSHEKMWLLDDQNNIQVHTFNYSPRTVPNSDNTLMLQAFTKPLTKRHLNKLEYDKTICMEYSHCCCWRSNIDDEIFLGGQQTITKLRDEDEGIREIIYKLWDKSLNVFSGRAITNCIHVLSCKNIHANSYMYSVNIPEKLQGGSQIHPMQKLPLTNPICMYTFSSTSYGAICKPKQTQFFSLKNILLDGPTYIGYDLDHDISDDDTVCALPDKHICVTSSLSGSLHIYTSHGKLVQTISIVDKPCDRAGHRLFVQCLNENIVAASEYGFITTHLIKCPSRRLSKRIQYDKPFRKLECMEYCAFNQKRLWIIDRDENRCVHISKY